VVDVLSDVIAGMRVGRPKFTRTSHTGPWGNRFGPYPGAGFHIVLQGACWLVPPAGDAVPLTAGDVVFLPHGAQHGVASDPVASPRLLPPAPPHDEVLDAGPDAAGVRLLCGAYRLDRGQAHPLLRELPDVVHLPARLGRHPDLRAAVELVGRDLEERRAGAAVALPALLDLLLVYILRAWLDEPTSAPSAGWAAALADPAVAAALERIHHAPAHPWTVQSLGAVAGLSRTAFARRFSAVVGQPPLAYLTWWRLTTGARLLRQTDAPLAAVARRVGYGSEFAFAAAFRREFGIAPGRYRRSAREGAPVAEDAALPD
jgi:AraC-like DNA-binding protein